ncbi:hypothetical protein L1049_014976 [Liquidambar formosana]|uniref:Pentatricopeptide repeat-containing protein n=1 Tax=Liquidambar formosana TaxID=63359 RepID=A0AAP0S393_LIQFO
MGHRRITFPGNKQTPTNLLQMAVPLIKRTFSSLPSDQIPQPQTLISSVVSILKHHRSKSRWSYLQSLYPTGFNPEEVSQITLHLKNNPRLALSFFLWSQQKSLCTHNLLSYSTIIHILARSRLKSQAQTLIRTAIRVTESASTDDSDPLSDSPPKIFETLVKTYRTCGSAPFVFDLLIKSCLEAKRIDGSLAIVRMLRSRGINPKVSTCNALVSRVLRCRGVNAGYTIYREVFGLNNELKEKFSVGICPNVHTFNALMVCYYQEGMTEKLEEIWYEMRKLNCFPNGYSYSILMAAYCDEGEVGEAEKVWEEMRIKGMEPDVVAYNTMIGGFCRIGEIGRAEEFYGEMMLSGVESTCVTYEHLINGHCKIGDVDAAILLYKDMCRKDFRAEALTVDAVIRELCDKKRISEALEFLRIAMKNHDFCANVNSYWVLIKGLCQERKMEEALKLQAEMVGKGFKPNLEIYSSFIDGYVKRGDEKMAEILRKEMFEIQMRGEED